MNNVMVKIGVQPVQHAKAPFTFKLLSRQPPNYQALVREAMVKFDLLKMVPPEGIIFWYRDAQDDRIEVSCDDDLNAAYMQASQVQSQPSLNLMVDFECNSANSQLFERLRESLVEGAMQKSSRMDPMNSLALQKLSINDQKQLIAQFFEKEKPKPKPELMFDSEVDFKKFEAQNPLLGQHELQESLQLSAAPPEIIKVENENLSENDRCLMEFYGMTEQQVRVSVRKLIEDEAKVMAEKMVQQYEQKFKVIMELMEELQGLNEKDAVAPIVARQPVEEQKQEEVIEQKPLSRESFEVIPKQEWLQFCQINQKLFASEGIIRSIYNKIRHPIQAQFKDVSLKEELVKIAVIQNKKDLFVQGKPGETVQVTVVIKNESPMIIWPEKSTLIKDKSESCTNLQLSKDYLLAKKKQYSISDRHQ